MDAKTCHQHMDLRLVLDYIAKAEEGTKDEAGNFLQRVFVGERGLCLRSVASGHQSFQHSRTPAFVTCFLISSLPSHIPWMEPLFGSVGP